MAHGDYGAAGRPSWDLLHAELDGLVSFRKGWRAQLNYLDRTRGGAAFLAREGLTPSRDQRRRWAGKGQPARTNQAAIDRAYRDLRRRNVVRILTRKLEAGGGTRVEVHPESQQPVQGPRRRSLSVLDINIRHWGRLVQAWATGDDTAFEQEWDSILDGSNRSDWSAYLYANSVGIQAF